MKRQTNFLGIIFFICICSSCGRTSDKKVSLNEIINTFDPLLSSKQNSYKTWGETENQSMANVDIFDATTLSIIENNFEHFSNSKDTVKAYMLSLANISTKYGNELESFIKDQPLKEKFRVKWRSYQEGVFGVMNYDLQIINNLQKVLIFLKDNRSNYKDDRDNIYFNNDDSLNEYKRLLEICSDPKIGVNQQEIRSKSIHDFLDALNIVKEVAKK